MWHRSVRDLMTASVVRVRLDTGFKEIVHQLADHDITAVPVVDDQERPLGVVSEADLLRKEAGEADPAGHLPTPDLSPTERARGEATTAEGLMSRPAIVARPQWSVVEAARAMDRHRVKRLLVVDDADRLIGIVSRSDLLRVFLRQDVHIWEEIVNDVLYGTLGLPRGAVTVSVEDGRVTLSGTVDRRSVIPIAVRLCEGVDGVVDVVNRLGYQIDDALT